MHDLVLKGGRVIDPSSGLDGAFDIAIDNGTIAQIVPHIAAADAARTVEVRCS